MSLEATDVVLDATPAIVTHVTAQWNHASISSSMTLSIGRLVQFALRHGLAISGAPRASYLAFEGTVAMFSVALPIASPADEPPATAFVELGSLPQLRGWRFEHRGPYDTLLSTWQRIFDWAVDARLIASRDEWERLLPIIEEYVSDPSQGPVSEMVTYVYVSRPAST